MTGHIDPRFVSWVVDKHDEEPYLEVKVPERFLLQSSLRISWMDEAVCLRRRDSPLNGSTHRLARCSVRRPPTAPWPPKAHQPGDERDEEKLAEQHLEHGD